MNCAIDAVDRIKGVPGGFYIVTSQRMLQRE
jgi:hypothetical protein